MSTLLFGGSFNPLHIGHLAIAEEAFYQLKLKKVVFLPSAQTPLKQSHSYAFHDEHRLAMLQEALTTVPWAQICPYELENRATAPHYAIDTVRKLKEWGLLSPDTYYMLGDDWVEHFDKWKKCDALSTETQLVLAARHGTSFTYPHTQLNNQVLPISSSDIRLRIKEKRSFRFLVPQEVYGYITQHNLYK